MNSFVSGLKQRFLGDERGNVAVIFGVTALVAMSAVGSAIDFARAGNERTRLQAAVDAGSLAGARWLDGHSDTDVTGVAGSFARAALPSSLSSATVTTEIVDNRTAVRVTASANVPTSISGIMGVNSMTISASATAVANMTNRKIEMALVLDNTGSMNDRIGNVRKIDAMKAAVRELLTTLESKRKTPEDVRVAVIPFDTIVRVGTKYAGANWLDTAPKKWDGCVRDRLQPYNVQDSTPAGLALFEPVKCNIDSAGNIAEMQPLTSDFGKIRASVDAMQPSGYTNVTIGFAWGWHALSAGQPLTETNAETDKDVDRWLVLLTDGLNTEDRWNATNSYYASLHKKTYSSAAPIDRRTADVCANIKAEGKINVVTIRLLEGNEALLKSCASKTSYYFNVQNLTQLHDAFKQIGQQADALRISR